MSWDRLDQIIEDRFDDSDLQDVPATHTYICEVDPQGDYDEARLALNDWLDERVNEVLGLDGADYMDTKGLVTHWLTSDLVEVVNDAWYFTREAEAKQWSKVVAK